VDLARTAVAVARDEALTWSSPWVVEASSTSARPSRCCSEWGRPTRLSRGDRGGSSYRQAVGAVRALPTTAGTGAEVTPNAVLASPEHGLKASLRSPLMFPRVAIVGPVAHNELPTLSHCVERDGRTDPVSRGLVSIRATPMTDALASEGLRRAAAGLRRSYADGSDMAARTDMALCSLLGGCHSRTPSWARCTAWQA